MNIYPCIAVIYCFRNWVKILLWLVKYKSKNDGSLNQTLTRCGEFWPDPNNYVHIQLIENPWIAVTFVFETEIGTENVAMTCKITLIDQKTKKNLTRGWPEKDLTRGWSENEGILNQTLTRCRNIWPDVNISGSLTIQYIAVTFALKTEFKTEKCRYDL